MASSLASDKPSLPAPGAMQYDPFVTNTPETAPTSAPAQHRYSNYDLDFFITGPSSPESAKRALTAHLQETERRLAEAGKLGNALVAQRKELTDQLKEIEKVNNEEELSQELRERMVGIEKEFNTLTRESARNLLPKQRVPSNEANPNSPFAPETKAGRLRSVSPSKFESQATGSPTKLTVPNRKIRNQPSNRVHDIEFAAEISTSLIAQVRNLQGVLAERDEENKDLKADKARLELESEGFQQRFKSLDESENRYKEENWNLETKLQELSAQHKEALDREKKLTQSLNIIKTEKVTVQRELDEVRVNHARLIDQHAAAVKQHDIELGTVKRNIAMAEGERAAMQRRIDDLTGQNQELARAFASQRRTVTELEPNIRTSDEDVDSSADHLTPEHSPPVSPIKGTPRHAMLETETMKSSLHHAQRTIQSQRGLLHREKTEKLELRRIIQDLRDDLEKARSDAGEQKPTRRSRAKEAKDFKKPPRLLGSFRSSRQEVIVDDQEWEDQSEVSPRTSVSPTNTRKALSNSSHTILPSIESADPTDTEQFDTANEGGESAFETANDERATETEDFQTGNEEMSGSDDTETETEGTTRGFGNLNAPRLTTGFPRHGSSLSLHSTASTSGEEDDVVSINTPSGTIRSQRSSRFRMSRNIFNRSRQVSEEPNFQGSPASFASSRDGTPQGGQSLFAELQDFDGSDDDSAGPGTPSRMRARSMTPGSIRRASSPRPAVPPMPKVIMVDSGVMTEPVKIVPRLTAFDTTQMITTGVMTDDGEEHYAESPVSVVTANRPGSMQSAIGSYGQRAPASWPIDELPESRPISMIYSDAGAQHDPDMEQKLAQFPAPPSMLPPILPPTLRMSSIAFEVVEPREEIEVPHVPAALSFTPLSNQSVEPLAEPETPPPALSLSSIKAEDLTPRAEPEAPLPDLTMTSIISEHLEPRAEPVVLPPALALSAIAAEHLEPLAEPEIPPPELSMSGIVAHSLEPKAEPLADLSLTEIVAEQVEPIAEPEIPAPALRLSTITAESVDPIASPPVEPVMFMAPPPALSMSSILGEHVEPIAQKNPELTISGIKGETVEPISEPAVPAPELLMSTIRSEHVEPVAEPEAESAMHSVVAPVPALSLAPKLSFSSIQGEDVEPVATRAPKLAMSAIFGEGVEPIVEPVPEPVVAQLSISSIQGEQIEPVVEATAVPELSISAIQGQYVQPTELPAPDLTLSSIAIESVEPISEPEKVVPLPSLNLSTIYAEGCEPREELPPTPTTLVFSDLSTQNVEPVSQPAPSLALSGITSENVKPVLEPTPAPPTLVMSSISAEGVEPVSPVQKALTLPSFGFSSIESVETLPMSPRTPKRDGFILPRDMNSPFMERDVPQTPEHQTAGALSRDVDQGSSPFMVEDVNSQSPSDASEPATPDSQRPFDKPVVMNDQGAQTSLTADVIDAMFKARALPAFGLDKNFIASPGTPGTTGTTGTVRIRRSREMFESPIRQERDADDVFDISPMRRPDSSRSGKASIQDVPPLPPNHRQVIEAARSHSSHGTQNTMAPPAWPASALKQRPTTPGNGASEVSTARATPTARTTRNPVSYGELGRQSPAKMSRRSSVSSFVSELDTRFNIRPGEMGMDPSGFGPNTDPRMIQAITQTMIGEYLWKYTRKTGRGEISENRHRRYFWVHPYTRTLYWSDRDPSAAGRTELKAKSVPIEAVRVVTDDNPNPPGLHRKSLVIISPGRTIKFTCTTGQRHETWFNALSYLLLRTNNEQANVEDIAENFTREDVDEFNPQFGQRAANGTRPRAPPSLSSYNSRTTRNESPAVGMSMNIPTLTPKGHPQRPAGTLSKLSGYWKGSQLSGTFSTLRGRGVSAQDVNIYEASEAHDSAEDVREIIERQDRDADRLENVRACCDGKHDVGTLHLSSKQGRHGSTHTHAHPARTQSHATMSSVRSRA